MCCVSVCCYQVISDCVHVAGESHEHLGVKELLHGFGAPARRSGGSQGDGNDE